MKKILFMMFVMVAITLGGFYLYEMQVSNNSLGSDDITNLFIFAGGMIAVLLLFFLGMAFYRKKHF